MKSAMALGAQIGRLNTAINDNSDFCGAIQTGFIVFIP
jgi:hypothetical protein